MSDTYDIEVEIVPVPEPERRWGTPGVGRFYLDADGDLFVYLGDERTNVHYPDERKPWGEILEDGTFALRCEGYPSSREPLTEIRVENRQAAIDKVTEG